MKNFINEMRKCADENYNKALPYIESKLKNGITDAASKGLRTAVVKIQGHDNGEHLIRRCKELGLKASFYSYYSWSICTVEF